MKIGVKFGVQFSIFFWRGDREAFLTRGCVGLYILLVVVYKRRSAGRGRGWKNKTVSRRNFEEFSRNFGGSEKSRGRIMNQPAY